MTLNVTVTDPAAAGFVTAYPCDQAVPLASNVNYGAGETVANAVTVAVSAAGEVCFRTFADTDLVVDATGWFDVAGSSQGSRFAPVPPARLLDTRSSVRLAAFRTVAVAAVGAPDGATAAVVNITATDPADDGFLVAYACDRPETATSTVNYRAGETVPNLAFVPLAPDGTICVRSFADTHVVVDVAGYFAP